MRQTHARFALPFVGTAAALLLCVVATGTSPALAARTPNIVVIVTDDQHAGTIGWMPTIRRELVRRGTTFTNAFAPTPTCCPSRASLFTGRYAQETRVWANGGSIDGTPIGGWPAFAAFGNEERTVATWLTASYRTILVGKYMNHFDEAPIGYVPAGWDRWHTFLGNNGSYYDYRLGHTDGSVTEHGSRPADYSTDVLSDLAVRSIRRTPPKKPLLMYFTPFAPHGPSVPARRHEGLGADLPPYDPPHVNESDVTDKPPWIQDLGRVSTKRIAKKRQGVFESLQAVDDGVRRIIRTLDRVGRLRDTLIVFVSDNGSSWGEHRIPVGDKFVPYDAQMRVPLVVRWDGRIAAGVRDPRLAANVDVPVTIARVAGIRPAGVDGRSLFRRRGRTGGIPLTAARSLERDGDGISFARPAYCGFLTRRFLYVSYATGHEELYAIRHDPYELRNRARDRRFAEVRSRMDAKAGRACVPRPPGF